MTQGYQKVSLTKESDDELQSYVARRQAPLQIAAKEEPPSRLGQPLIIFQGSLERIATDYFATRNMRYAAKCPDR